jgi:hypothetical protein
MGVRGGGLASTPVSVQPINPLQSRRQPHEHRTVLFFLYYTVDAVRRIEIEGDTSGIQNIGAPVRLRLPFFLYRFVSSVGLSRFSFVFRHDIV